MKENINRNLNKNDYKTLALSSFGAMLEFYDFVIFVFFTSILSKYFFPADDAFIAELKTLGIFAAGYLARPIGGVIIAHFGDKLGRKKMFAFSIFMMAVPTLIIGLLPTYEQVGVLASVLLLLCRIFQGAAVGGQVPGVWVFIAEHMPRQKYGLSMGVVNAGITSGILLGLIVAMLVNSSSLSLDYAWRIPFILGGIFGLISVYLRRFLEETPIFQEIKARIKQMKELPIKTVLREHKKACLITAAFSFFHASTAGMVILMTPNVVLENLYKLPRELSLEASCFATLTFIIGFVFWGYLEDILKTRLNLAIACLGLILCLFYFYSSLSLDISPNELILKYSLLGFFTAAIVMTPIISTRAFPPQVRYSGLSFAYNLSYAIFGGLTPIIAAAWLGLSHMAPAYFVSIAAIIAMITSTFKLAYKGYGS